MAGGIRNWDQHTGLVSSGVSSCISLLFDGVLDPKDISWDLLVMMSGQKLQVKHRSKRMQELSPGSAPNKPAIQALLQGIAVVSGAGLGWDVLR